MDVQGLQLFDSNCNHPLNQIPLDGQKWLLAEPMHQFREFPMCRGGFNEERLRFYDGVLGGLIRMRDCAIEHGLMGQISGLADFTSHWEYRGDIYRVIDKAMVFPKNGEPYYRMPAIKWHGMVASWSRSFDFTTNFNHMDADSKYTIIHANTGDSAGIDANKFSEYLGCYNPYTASENEVIFPMKKEFVVKIYKNTTPSEFKALMENEVKG